MPHSKFNGKTFYLISGKIEFISLLKTGRGYCQWTVRFPILGANLQTVCLNCLFKYANCFARFRASQCSCEHEFDRRISLQAMLRGYLRNVFVLLYVTLFI